MDEVRCFDYKGFHSKKAYWKDKFKSLIGRGESKNSILTRRKKLIEYYKKHPQKLHQKGKSESKDSFNRKIKESRSTVVSRRSNKLNKAIRSTGSSYTPGKYATKVKKVASPMVMIPVPGTTEVVGTAILGATLADKAKMMHLKRNKDVKLASKSLNEIEREINNEDKLQSKKSKLLRKK